jgi:hypothetical protein
VSDPELDAMLKRFLAEAAAERQNGVTLSSVHKTVTDLSDSFLAHVKNDDERFAVQDDRWSRWRAKWRHFIESGRREPMASMPDDSGSIDISIAGQHAHFAGKWPVRVGLTLVVVFALGGAGYCVHALTHPAAATERRDP